LKAGLSIHCSIYRQTVNVNLLLPKKVLFLTLRIFSATGGIEKVCRIAAKALYETGLQNGGSVSIFSLDGKKGRQENDRYFPQIIHTCFEDNKIRYALKSILVGRDRDIVLMSHINLLIVGTLIKMIKPSVKLVLMAHGIEVWAPLAAWKRYLLRKIDLFLPVSNFTKDKMKALHGIPEEKSAVLNNCIDPFLEKPQQKTKSRFLQERYGLKDGHTVLLTLCRMADAEKYKGYDRVLESLQNLVIQYPGLRYLLAGKYDDKEKRRLDHLITTLCLQDIVVFTGFIADEEMPLHFNLADIFIMPSVGEGFGLVFIEAMFYGLPVIAGNAGGSVDALVNGDFGILIDPFDKSATAEAIKKIIDNPTQYKPSHQKLVELFGYTGYKKALGNYLYGLSGS
jgi:glycosyltransferase involved in cell wall biosynthesis